MKPLTNLLSILPTVVVLSSGMPASAQTFSDVPTTHWAYNFIETLYDSGITGGCGDGKYCPDAAVTRAQMAVLLMRAINTATLASQATSSIQQLTITKTFELPDTLDSTTGVIYKEVNPFMHNYKGADTEGSNLFLGENAGNFTMWSEDPDDQPHQGSHNTGIGANTLSSNTTGYYNTTTGAEALRSNTTGNANTAIGFNALLSNTTGFRNTANGTWTLLDNTTGSANTASGVDALRSNTTGGLNTAHGLSALEKNTEGSANTAMGADALLNNTVGEANTALGFKAGNNITSGSNNIIIGYMIDAPSATGSNQMSIGNLIFATGVDGTGTTISSGNVGIGTTTPQSALQVSGYVQLDLTTDSPPASDCDEASEWGRMKVDGFSGLLHICVASGWVAK